MLAAGETRRCPRVWRSDNAAYRASLVTALAFKLMVLSLLHHGNFATLARFRGRKVTSAPSNGHKEKLSMPFLRTAISLAASVTLLVGAELKTGIARLV